MSRFPAPPNYRRADINGGQQFIETKQALAEAEAIPAAAIYPAVVDVSSYAGAILNLHDEETVSITDEGDGWYEVTWTGSGGNANDTLGEQLILLYALEDPLGETVDLTGQGYVVRWYLEFDDASWSGANEVLVSAGVMFSDGTTFAAPGSVIAGSVALGASGAGRVRNSSWVGGQSASVTQVSTIHGVLLPDESGDNDRGFGVFQAYAEDGSLVETGSIGFESTDISTAGLISFGIALGNDNSLTSGATYTERVRLRVALYTNTP